MRKPPLILTIIGCTLLVPGVCGTIFFGQTFFVSNHSASAIPPPLMGSLGAVPAIQIGCLGLWLLSRTSDKIWLRNLTRCFGWLAAFSTLVFALRIILFLLQPNSYVRLHFLGAAGSYFAMVIFPFLLGGLPALLLKPYPENRHRNDADKERP